MNLGRAMATKGDLSFDADREKGTGVTLDDSGWSIFQKTSHVSRARSGS